MRKERLEILKDNEQHLAKGAEGNYESVSDDENEEDMGEASSDEE